MANKTGVSLGLQITPSDMSFVKKQLDDLIKTYSSKKISINIDSNTIKQAAEQTSKFNLNVNNSVTNLQRASNQAEQLSNRLKQIGSNKDFEQAFSKNPQYKTQFDSLSKSVDDFAIGLKNGTRSSEEWKNANLNNEIKTLSSNLKVSTNQMDTFTSTISDNIRAFTSWYLIGGLVSGVSRSFSEMTETVKNLNGNLVNLQMATGGTAQEAQQLLNTYNQMAQEMGATTGEVSDSADSFLRQGQSIADTNTLIKDSMVLSKVAQLDSADSTQFLTSAMKGYKVAVSDVIGIVDKLSSVDLVSATSAGGLAEAMSRTANMADNLGISMDALLGYLATMGEVTQKDMSSIGESMKTFLSRMSSVKVGKYISDEGDDLSNVETILRKFNISLRDSTDEFRNFQDVLDDVGSKWDTYSSVQKAAIANAFAGVRQQENFTALLNNYGKALDYANVAANSAGTALEKFKAYEDSVEASTKRLTAAWESFASSSISADTLKGFINIGITMVNILDLLLNKTGGLIPIIASVTAAYVLLNVVIKNNTLTTIAAIIPETGRALAMAASAIAAGNLSEALVALNLSGGAVTIVIAAIAAVIWGVVKAFEATDESLEKQSKSLQSLESDYDSIMSKLQELQTEQQNVLKNINELNDIRGKSGLTTAEQEQYDNLVNTNKQLQLQIDYQNTLKNIKNQDIQDKAAKLLTTANQVSEYADFSDPYTKSFLTPVEKIQENIGLINEYKDQINDLSDKTKNLSLTEEQRVSQINDLKLKQAELIKQNDVLITSVEDASSKLTDQTGANYDLKLSTDKTVTAAKNAANSFNGISDTANKAKGSIQETTEAVTDQQQEVKSLSDLVNSSLDTYESLNDAIYKVKNGYALSESEIDKLLKAHPELLSSIIAVKDGYTIEESALRSLWNTQTSQARAQAQSQLNSATDTIKAVKSRIQAYLAEISVLQSLGGLNGKTGVLADIQVLGDADKIRGLNDQLKQAEDAQKTAQSALKMIDNLSSNIGSSLDKGTSSGSSSKDKTYEYDHFIEQQQAVADIQQKLTVLGHELNNLDDDSVEGLQRKNELLSQQNELYKQEQSALHTLNEARRQEILNGAKILENMGVQVSYDAQLNRLVIDYSDIAKMTGNARDNADKLAKSMEDLNKDNQDASDTYLDLTDSINKNTQAVEDNVKSIRENQFKALQDGINEYINYLEDAKDKAADVINSQIDALEKQHDAQSDVNSLLEKQNNLIKAQQELTNAFNERNVKQLQGTKWEWVSDPSTITKLQETVSEAQKALDTEISEQNYKKLVDSLKEQLAQSNNAYDAQIDSLRKMLDGQENLLTGTINGLITNLDQLNSYLSAYGVSVIGNGLGGYTVDGNSSSTGSNANYSVFTNDVAAQMMKDNSIAYGSATEADKQLLHKQNEDLANGRGWTFDPSSGKWLDKYGIPIYHSGTAGAGGTTVVPGQNELFALINKGEQIYNADQIPNLMKLVSLGALTSSLMKNQTSNVNNSTNFSGITINNHGDLDVDGFVRLAKSIPVKRR